jgi:RHS repeat-associated protein
VDGRTVTNLAAGIRWPDMAYYPFVGKAWEAAPGVMTNLAGGDGLIYLPLIRRGTLQTISLVSNTVITFPPSVVASNPALAGVSLSVPAGALYNDNGTRGGQVGIAPVPPDRLPEPLPPGLNLPLVITVQTDGPQNFSEPVPICFPNLPDPQSGEVLPPGAKTALWSFNHDTGRWEVVGPMTVSPDGLFACTDPGVGIRQPGWHGAFPGSQGPAPPGGGGGDDCSDGCCGECCEPEGVNCALVPGCKQSAGSGNPTNPVRLYSGEKYESVVDLYIKGVGLDFVWERTYESKHGLNTAQGKGWDFSYDLAVALEGRGTRAFGGIGRTELYHPTASGTWARRGLARELALATDASPTLQYDNQTLLRFFPFDGTLTAGKVRSVSDRNGNTLHFAYDAQGRLSTITDTLDRAISIAYNADGFIESVTDFAGRSVRYTYYGHDEPGGSFGDLKSVTSPVVVGTPNGNDFPDGKTTTYTYTRDFADDRLNHNLLTITDGRRNDPADPTFGAGPYLVNVYSPTTDPDDPQFDRVIRQIRGGSVIDITYVPQQPSLANDLIYMNTIVRDGMGNVSEWFYKVSNQLVRERHYTGRSATNNPVTEFANRPTGKLRQSDPAYFETRYEYNADFALTRTTYHNGNIVENVYEGDLNPAATARTRRNLRTIRRLPGTHLPAGDQAVITEEFEYDDSFGCGACGFNFVTRHRDGRGNETRSQYDTHGNLIARTNGISSIVQNYEYNARGQMIRRVLPDNGSGSRRVDEFSYFAAGPQRGYLQSEIIDAANMRLTTSYEYDAVGNVVRRIDPRGHDDQYIVNPLDQTVRQISREVADGSGIRYRRDYFYDANNNMVRLDVQNVDGNGVLQSNPHFSTLYGYEILNHLVRRVQEADEITDVVNEYTYDANRNLVRERFGEASAGRQADNVVQMDYDERDLLYRKIIAPGSTNRATEEFDYDGNGSLIEQRSGLESGAHTSVNVYDGYDRLVNVTDPMGNTRSYQYDAAGNKVHELILGELHDQPGSANNVRLYEASMFYDAMNRLTRNEVEFFDPATQLTIGDGKVISQARYSDTSQVIARTNDNGHVTRFSYDTVNRRKVTTDPKGNTLTYSYDLNSNVIEVRSVEKNDLGGPDELFGTSYAYDNLDRLISETDNAGNTSQLAYDSRGNLVRFRDARGNLTAYSFDGLNRQVEIVRSLTTTGTGGGTTVRTVRNTQHWDASDRITQRTDDRGEATRYFYDGASRLVKVQFADGTTATTVYDAHHCRVRVGDPNGTIQLLSYDALDRLLQRNVAPAPGISSDTTFERFQYDGLSRTVSAQNDSSIVTFAFDSQSHEILESQDGNVTRSTNDGIGNILSCVYPGGRVLNYTHDELERKQQVSDERGLIVDYRYVGPGRVAQRDYGNGTRWQPRYDGITGTPNEPGDFGVKQLSRNRHVRNSDGLNLVDEAYKFDPSYNKVSTTNQLSGSPAEEYSYDSINRLIHSKRNIAMGPAQTNTYTLDGNGNRSAVTGGPDAGSYVLNDTRPEPADGALNQYTTTPFDVREYDKNGNLVFTDRALASQRSFAYDYRNRLVSYVDASGLRTTYRYDALGRRIAKTTHSVPAQTNRFVFKGQREIEEQDGSGATQASYVYGHYVDDLLTMRRAGVDFFYHSDNQYSVVAVTGVDGTVVERYHYGDFGLPTVLDADGAAQAASAIANPYLFTGRRFDTESGLYFYRTRHLDPRVGRFISRDPLGLWTDSVNLGNAYAYVGNNPGSRSDSMGLADPVTTTAVQTAVELAEGAESAGATAEEIAALESTIARSLAQASARAAAAEVATAAEQVAAFEAALAETEVGVLAGATETAAVGVGTVAGAVAVAGATGVAIGLIINEVYGDNIQNALDQVFGDEDMPDPFGGDLASPEPAPDPNPQPEPDPEPDPQPDPRPDPQPDPNPNPNPADPVPNPNPGPGPGGPGNPGGGRRCPPNPQDRTSYGYDPRDAVASRRRDLQENAPPGCRVNCMEVAGHRKRCGRGFYVRVHCEYEER